MPVNATARMIQKDKRFLPHVLPIEVGTVVDFPNLDPIFHNAFSSFDGQIFDIGLYAPSTSRSVRFSRKGIVRVFCNIHASMSAVIIVLDTPFFVTPIGDGRFVLQNVPPGDYTMRVFDERAKPEYFGLTGEATEGNCRWIESAASQYLGGRLSASRAQKQIRHGLSSQRT